MKKVLMIIFLSFISYNLIYGLKLYLDKGIILSKTNIITDLLNQSNLPDKIEIEAIFGGTYGKIFIDLDSIAFIEPEDDNILVPEIIEKKGNITINSFFIESTDIIRIPPYTFLETDKDGYILIAMNQKPAYMIYPESNIYFDFEVSGLPKQFPVIENRYIGDLSGIMISENYVYRLNHGLIIGIDYNNKLKDEYNIWLTEDIYLKINSSVYYINALLNEFTIAVLDGSITFYEPNEAPKIITSNQIADIFIDKEEYMTIQTLNKNEYVHNLLNKIKAGHYYPDE